ncbi:hypothetical protein EPUS_09090 [Endocarpon pusillum Z07020]|uniref:pH-response transcription factor pacC/RIM101 n=1 Tax=Endocarpon pusillum (strain Z07020 / HMAS-L-300199) TaxID=1263415 RepID=U1HL31_ENDPU|nr:uncharacterized protein EPUS_09090 [Endocarpon pusillum Z07020]ERF70985.1 hypothetical protein EPUS_09090 [Endocarpon pusillum Z07020]
MSTPQETQQAVVDQQQPAQVPQPVSTPSAVNNGGENLQCQWQGCGERCASAEALYEHVCERHVGRKSTNNLNLTCQWGSCRTTTVKRDHITSHIRVHVPLKPHKCEFCGKAFKRPQDLKKHVKTHADDSVILRSPEPGQPRQSGNMYVPNEKGPSTYYNAINPNGGYDSGHPQGPNQYYQPQHAHQASHPPYGNVYYTAAPTQQAAFNDFEARKRGFEALDNFFGEVKAGRFAPLTYQNISQRLFELQGLQLPLIAQPPLSAIPAYQPVSAVAGSVGGYNSNDPMQGYSLPPMGNAKSRGDLTSIDRLLEQMQAAIYENDSQLAQAGVAQPGAHYVNYRTGNSPPGVQLPAAHAQSTPMMSQQQQHHHHNPSIASATESVHSSTPALTPPSSAQSYTSGHSPVSHNMTPLQAPTSNGNAMYPSLPTGTLDNGFPNATPAPNAATLGNLYDGEEHPTHNAKAAAARKRRGQAPASSVIDPALSGMGSEESAAAVAAASLESPASNASGCEITERDAEKERAWVDSMRLIEWMRDYVKKRLQEGDFDEDQTVSEEQGKDVDMGSGEVNSNNQNGKEDLYPTLKGMGN